MISPLAKFIDWSSIQASAMRSLPPSGRDPRLEEALQFVRGANFIPAESQPAQVEFDDDKSGLHFRFTTPRPSDLAENNVVYGRLYRCAERWQERPVIILLHGWNGVISHRFRFPLIAHRSNRAGFNAATLVGPCHFQRRPRRFRALTGPDYLRMAETTAQAIAEIRALTKWLLEEGCPAVALWGISWGGWLAGLTLATTRNITTPI
jgi:pimeloyl-ACP methyl ester carboxylesterase